MTRKLTRNVLAATALAGIFSAMAVTTAVSEEARVSSKTLTVCDGGAQEAVITNAENSPKTTTSTSFVDVPGTTLPGFASGLAGDSDTYIVQFSAEADKIGGGTMEVQALASINGGAFTVINPTGPNSFQTGAKEGTHTMTWCLRTVATSSANFKVQFRSSSGPIGAIAQLDDYLIKVERSN